ncbi:MAG: flagellar biosynthetic protein FliO [Gammaproteobacteria bacterium]|nr:flagellar biosynthetic protein FliO [Gammaproteobacteria bacterium]MDH5777669.1 flagellar biosynthetic protein FliO [Gammaproteobacteria bacterium]
MIFQRCKRRVFGALLVIFSLPVLAANPNMTERTGPLVTEPVGFGDYVQMFFGLALVLGIIFGMAWLIRRMGTLQHVGHSSLCILGGVSLGQRERVVLLQVGEQQLLVGIAPGQIRTLHVLEKPIATNPNQSSTSSGFAEKLHAAMTGKKR